MHNGIIENFQELRDELEAAGCRFETETDTEVVAHLLTRYLEQQMTPQQAMAIAMERLQGAFALAVIFAGRARPDDRRTARQPAGGRLWRRRDVSSAPMRWRSPRCTARICYLEEDDWVVLTRDGAEICNGGKRVERRVTQTALSRCRGRQGQSSAISC